MIALGFSIGISYRFTIRSVDFQLQAREWARERRTYAVVGAVRPVYRWLIGARCPSHVSVEGFAMGALWDWLSHSLLRSLSRSLTIRLISFDPSLFTRLIVQLIPKTV